MQPAFQPGFQLAGIVIQLLRARNAAIIKAKCLGQAFYQYGVLL
jgi:hypothetical protein